MRLRKRLSLRVILYAVIGLLLLRLLYQKLAPFLNVQLYHMSWHNHSILYFFGLSNLLSKEPFLQIVNEHAVDVVFEVRHDPQKFMSHSQEDTTPTLHWFTEGKRPIAVPATMLHDEFETYVFRARISDPILVHANFQYRLEIGSWRSKVYHSELFGKRNGPHSVRLGVLGDNQFAAVKFSEILTRMTSVYTLAQYNAFIHLGDAVQDAASARAWSTDFWRPLSAHGLLARPWIMLRGNHDAPSFYTFAPRGKNDLGYTSFYIPSTNTFFMVLDSNTDSELQDRYVAAKLQSELAQLAGRRIVLVHIPPFVEFWDPVPWQSGEKLWGSFVRTTWVPLFQKYNVDLVISGHQHNYQRGTKHGVTYVIAGGAGGTLDHVRVEDYRLDDSVTIFKHHFGVLELDNERGIHWKLYLADGSLADELLI